MGDSLMFLAIGFGMLGMLWGMRRLEQHVRSLTREVTEGTRRIDAHEEMLVSQMTMVQDLQMQNAVRIPRPTNGYRGPGANERTIG